MRGGRSSTAGDRRSAHLAGVRVVPDEGLATGLLPLPAAQPAWIQHPRDNCMQRISVGLLDAGSHMGSILSLGTRSSALQPAWSTWPRPRTAVRVIDLIFDPTRRSAGHTAAGPGRVCVVQILCGRVERQWFLQSVLDDVVTSHTLV